jgi:hypothetical protein
MTPFGAQPLLGAAIKLLRWLRIAILKAAPFHYRREARQAVISRCGERRVG